MDWKDVGDGIAKVAPTIAGVLTNVALPGMGPLAAAGTKALLSALGLGEDATPEDVQNVLATADPETLLKIKQADLQFAKDMRQLDVDLEKIYAGDRDSARRMAIETKDKTPVVFGILITFAFCGMLTALMFRVVPPENQNVFFSSLGVLGTVFTAFATFLYGANKDTKLTTQLLAASNSVVAAKDDLTNKSSGWSIRRS